MFHGKMMVVKCIQVGTCQYDFVDNLGPPSTGETLSNFFKIIEINYVIIRINLCRCVE